jgi:hypothetical protein
MNEDIETEEMLDWVRALRLPEAEFRAYVRPHFEDTEAMEKYIDSKPELRKHRGRHRA